MRFSPYPWSEKDMIGGNAALDFVNTAADWASGDPEDRLGGPEGFGKWAEMAGLLYADDMKRLREEIAADPKAGEDAFETAIRLRAALWRIFNAVITDAEVDEDDLAFVEAAEDFLLNGRLDRLHACGGDACEWLFVDTSKNGKRRWCDMATCGNDAKVKKFRKRNKKAA